MVKVITAFTCGLIFAVGLAIAGMTQPAKVIGFLNLRGAWDPSLMFVLGGAAGTYLLLRPFVLKRGAPLFENTFSLPPLKQVDRKLVLGAVLFGLGWGLSGICPGPAVTSVAAGLGYVPAFTGAMLIGIFMTDTYLKMRSP